MDLVVKSDGAPPVWTHFLLTSLQMKVKVTDTANETKEVPLAKAVNEFRWVMPNNTHEFDLIIEAAFAFEGRSYPLLRIVQRFGVDKDTNTGAIVGLKTLRWQKMSPDQTAGLAKGSPQVHPLLSVAAAQAMVTLKIAFVDITNLFLDMHGNTPWFRALELLKRTPRTIRVLASLRGHPLVWYVVIPQSVVALQELKPVVLYYPADYGGIAYDNTLAGLKSTAHDTSVDRVQCGGETLVSFLAKPLSDDDYDAGLDKFVEMRDKFKKRQGRNPPAFHHYREVLSYHASGNTLVPDYWDVPFGFETAIAEHKRILLIPQINGGQGGVAIQAGLKELVASALTMIYTQGNHLTCDTITIGKLILACYSQSGGNVFTAASKNATDLQAIVCLEPQYMNAHLKGEDKTLLLGKKVIPLLISQGVKVAIVGRHKDGWETKYLPERVAINDLIVFPDDPNYFLLNYPDAKKPYDPNASPILARRYSRLLKNKADTVAKGLVGGTFGDRDPDSALAEEKVEKIIEKHRAAAMNDETLVKTVFTASYNADTSGGYYTHNFIIASGQEMDGASIRTFFNQVLKEIDKPPRP